ncbi:MAG: hypothetical protein ACK41O_26730 [Runella zeae]
MRKKSQLFALEGHEDTVTGISLSADGSYLLTNAMDNTVRIFDVRPFVAGGDAARCVKVFYGVQHGLEKNLLRCAWTTDGSKVAAGSSDSFVFVW